MSYFIITAIKYNPEDKKIHLSGYPNNVRPHIPKPATYKDNKDLLKDLISGSAQLKAKSQFAQKISGALSIIEQHHKQQFGERQNNHSETLRSINPFSLFQISNYDLSSKKENINKMKDISRLSKDYIDERLKDAKATEEVYDEACIFYNKMETMFFETIGVPIHSDVPIPTNQANQLSLF